MKQIRLGNLRLGAGGVKKKPCTKNLTFWESNLDFANNRMLDISGLNNHAPLGESNTMRFNGITGGTLITYPLGYGNQLTTGFTLFTKAYIAPDEKFWRKLFSTTLVQFNFGVTAGVLQIAWSLNQNIVSTTFGNISGSVRNIAITVNGANSFFYVDGVTEACNIPTMTSYSDAALSPNRVLAGASFHKYFDGISNSPLTKDHIDDIFINQKFDDKNLYTFIPYCWGNGTNAYDVALGLEVPITGTLDAEIYTTKQNIFHYNLQCGFDLWIKTTDETYLRVPLKFDGTSIRGDGDTIPGYTWLKKCPASLAYHNLAETKITLPSSGLVDVYNIESDADYLSTLFSSKVYQTITTPETLVFTGSSTPAVGNYGLLLNSSTFQLSTYVYSNSGSSWTDVWNALAVLINAEGYYSATVNGNVISIVSGTRILSTSASGSAGSNVTKSVAPIGSTLMQIGVNKILNYSTTTQFTNESRYYYLCEYGGGNPSVDPTDGICYKTNEDFSLVEAINVKSRITAAGYNYSYTTFFAARDIFKIPSGGFICVDNNRLVLFFDENFNYTGKYINCRVQMSGMSEGVCFVNESGINYIYVVERTLTNVYKYRVYDSNQGNPEGTGTLGIQVGSYIGNYAATNNMMSVKKFSDGCFYVCNGNSNKIIRYDNSFTIVNSYTKVFYELVGEISNWYGLGEVPIGYIIPLTTGGRVWNGSAWINQTAPVTISNTCICVIDIGSDRLVFFNLADMVQICHIPVPSYIGASGTQTTITGIEALQVYTPSDCLMKTAKYNDYTIITDDAGDYLTDDNNNLIIE